jgi:hypothetical protein
MDLIMGDRRAGRRFEMELKLRYRLLGGGLTLYEGSGVTTDMSRGGLSFRTSGWLPQGVPIELRIEWPIALRGRYPQELHLMGHVVRSEAGAVGVRASWHEFVRSEVPAPIAAEFEEAAAAMVM